MSARAVLYRLGTRDYREVWAAMRAWIDARSRDSDDQLWLVEHPPVYTLGQAGRREHLLAPGAIPVVDSDRGGQVTYHGPGQAVLYTLLDLRRLGLGVRALVDALEGAVIDLLATHGLSAHARADAPGVYLEHDFGDGPEPAKIASLGLRVRRGCCYHGVALNVRMNLDPFRGIDPCGLPGLKMTHLADFVATAEVEVIGGALAAALARRLSLSLVEAPGLPPPIAAP
jgi:lipoate-protein ligase B